MSNTAATAPEISHPSQLPAVDKVLLAIEMQVLRESYGLDACTKAVRDVLTGLLTSLLAQGTEPFAACCAAVWLHGRAGDLAAQEKGQWGMTPTDLLERLPQALREVT